MLYAIGLAWPGNGEAVIRSLVPAAGRTREGASLLGSDAKVQFDQQGDGLHVKLPANLRLNMHTSFA